MMTFLEYCLEQLLGPPIRRAQPGESYHFCPQCSSPKFHSMPPKPPYKSRARCYACGFLADIFDVLKQQFPAEDYGQRRCRAAELRESYEKLGPADKTAKEEQPANDATPSYPRGPRRYREEPPDVDSAWADLTGAEHDALVAAREVMARVNGVRSVKVPFEPLADYAWQFDEWVKMTDQQHAAECTDPNCDARICRAARGLPPLSEDEVAADRDRARRESEDRIAQQVAARNRRRRRLSN